MAIFWLFGHFCSRSINLSHTYSWSDLSGHLGHLLLAYLAKSVFERHLEFFLLFATLASFLLQLLLGGFAGIKGLLVLTFVLFSDGVVTIAVCVIFIFLGILFEGGLTVLLLELLADFNFFSDGDEAVEAIDGDFKLSMELYLCFFVNFDFRLSLNDAWVVVSVGVGSQDGLSVPLLLGIFLRLF